MQTGGKTWSEDLQRYEYQRRDRANWPVPDPNPRSGPLVEIDPYRGTGVPQQQRFGANHGRDTLRDEFRDPERQRQMLEAEAAAATRTKLKQVPGTGPYAGGLRHPPRGENNREGREHLFDALQHVAAGAPTPGLDTAGRSNPDSWIGTRNYDPNKGRRFAPNDGTTRDKGQPLDAGRPDLFTVVQPEERERRADDRATDIWIGNKSHKPNEGRSHATAGMYVPTTHRGRRDLFAVISGRQPDEDDRSKDSWLGNMLYDPYKTRARPDSQEDELGVGLMKVKQSTKEAWLTQRMRPLEAKGELEPVIKPEFYKGDKNFVDPELRRGPKKIEPPPAPSGRTSFEPVIKQDPNLRDDFGVRRKKEVRVPGSDTQPGKGSMLLYTNEYCSTLAKRGVVE